MTIKELLGLPNTELEALSDKELHKLLDPFIPLARAPDKAANYDDVQAIMAKLNKLIAATPSKSNDTSTN